MLCIYTHVSRQHLVILTSWWCDYIDLGNIWLFLLQLELWCKTTETQLSYETDVLGYETSKNVSYVCVEHDHVESMGHVEEDRGHGKHPHGT